MFFVSTSGVLYTTIPLTRWASTEPKKWDVIRTSTDLEDIGAPAVLGAPFPLNSCQKASAATHLPKPQELEAYTNCLEPPQEPPNSNSFLKLFSVSAIERKKMGFKSQVQILDL